MARRHLAIIIEDLGGIVSSVKPGKTLLWLIKASNLRPLIIGSGAARGWPCRRVQRYVVRHSGRFARQGASDSASGTPVAEMGKTEPAPTQVNPLQDSSRNWLY